MIDSFRISGSDGFSEGTQDSVCTQYSSRDCNRYWDCLGKFVTSLVINQFLTTKQDVVS